jgi:hypothetical protein
MRELRNPRALFVAGIRYIRVHQYDALNSYGSLAYHAQIMFSSCLGDQTMESNVSGAGDKFFWLCSRIYG